jgi:Protein of unknown function (DUF2796)
MYRPTLTPPLLALAIALSWSGGTTWAAGKAHEHGAIKLDVSIEGNTLTIAMEAPLDNLLGFERVPRTDAERKLASDVLTRLRGPDKGTPLFATDAAAQCTLSKAEVLAPVLEPSAKPGSKDEHADLDARYEFTCAKPDDLRTLDLGLFDAYKSTRRIDVQVAGPKGQAKVTLKRPARKVQLLR